MISRVSSLAALAVLLSAPARADCSLTPYPCSTDAHGNTYITTETLGGGYATSRNGVPYSSTHQNLSGSYTESWHGGSRTYNSDPYAPAFKR